MTALPNQKKMMHTYSVAVACGKALLLLLLLLLLLQGLVL
jgi:hypothetical protein